jgi:hypothetical protein
MLSPQISWTGDFNFSPMEEQNSVMLNLLQTEVLVLAPQPVAKIKQNKRRYFRTESP